jgi:hypothetical protein
MGDEAVKWDFKILKLSESELVLEHFFSDDSPKTISTYKRMLKIAPYNSMGGYTVTELDGSIIYIVGFY